MHLTKLPRILVIGEQSVIVNSETRANIHSIMKRVCTQYSDLHVQLSVGRGVGVDTIVREFAASNRNLVSMKLYNNAMFAKDGSVYSLKQLARYYEQLGNHKLPNGEYAYDATVIIHNGGYSHTMLESLNIANLHHVFKLPNPSPTLNEGMGDVFDTGLDIVPIEYDLNEDSIGTYGGELVLDIASSHSMLAQFISNTTSTKGIKPHLIYARDSINGSQSDRTAFLTIPTTINRKFNLERYIANIYGIKEIADLHGLKDIKLPRLGSDILNGIWQRVGLPLARILFDGRFTVYEPRIEYPSDVTSDDLRKYSKEVTESSNQFIYYELAKGIEFNGDLDALVAQIVSLQETLVEDYIEAHGEVLDHDLMSKTIDTELQRILEYTFSKQNAKRYFYEDIKTIDGLDMQLMLAEHNIRNWAEDQSSDNLAMNLDKSKLLMHGFDIKNMIVDMLIEIQAYKTKIANPELSAIAGILRKTTPFGKPLVDIPNDTPLAAHKRALQLTYGILAQLENTHILHRTKQKRTRYVESTGSKETINIWCIEALDFISDATAKICSLSHKLPPMICEPREVTRNDMSAYQTIKGNVISNPIFQHSGELCLDVINLYNKVACKIDMDSALGIKLEFDKPKNYAFLTDKQKKRVREVWNEQEELRQFSMKLMYALGNRFHFNWFYDYRGRTYSSGHYINIQGSDHKKASVMFADGSAIFARDCIADLNLETTTAEFLLTLPEITLPSVDQ